MIPVDIENIDAQPRMGETELEIEYKLSIPRVAAKKYTVQLDSRRYDDFKKLIYDKQPDATTEVIAEDLNTKFLQTKPYKTQVVKEELELKTFETIKNTEYLNDGTKDVTFRATNGEDDIGSLRVKLKMGRENAGRDSSIEEFYVVERDDIESGGRPTLATEEIKGISKVRICLDGLHKLADKKAE
eukprot:GAHX01001174.1.p1 GENE.GAHX01001174.1~~GAHX01001174.1.p1  ORF type:complete len:186 (+),score=46.21 GAHX01001174.1:201-758(+)